VRSPSGHDRPPVGRAGCFALIALGYLTAAINVAMNIRYGERMSVDLDGYYLQGAALLATSIGPAIAASVTGGFARAGWHIRAALIFLFGLGLISFSVWNASQFTADQMVGKIKLAEARQKQASDIAQITNDTRLQERRELNEFYRRTYTIAKTKEGRESAREALDVATERPIALVAPTIDFAVTEARTSLAHKWLGWDREAVQGASAAALPIVLAAIEVAFPLFGFWGWPASQRNGRADPKSPERFRQSPAFRKAEARADLLRMIAQNLPPPHGEELALRWGVRPAQVSKWLECWRREGLITRKRQGQRVVVLPAPRKPTAVNGSAVMTMT
jgi:transposase-like protein